MKKYTSDEFVATKYGIYKAAQDILTSFPSTIIVNSGNVAPWAIYGNENSGDYVGDKTNNLFYSSNNQTIGSTLRVTQTIGNSRFILNKDVSYSDTSTNIDIDITLSAGTYTLSVTDLNLYDNDYDRIFLRDDNSNVVVNNVQFNHPQNFTLTKTTHIYRCTVVASASSTYNNSNISIMLNTGSSALSYEPFGYKIPFSCGENNYTIYMTDVLRKSSGLDPVYDVISSSGTITRNVDTDGTPLVTPTTESFTAPTIATAAGNNIINFGTTVKPSKMELTYTGWHMYDDKKHTGGEWS